MVAFIHREGSPYIITTTSTIGDWYSRQEYEASFNPVPFPAVRINTRQAYGYYSTHLDIKYPHVCFKCKKKLKFKELFNANRKNCYSFDMPLYRKLKKLWRSQVVEFYCCECFSDAKIEFIESCII